MSVPPLMERISAALSPMADTPPLPPVADNSPADKLKPDPIWISSMAPVPLEVLPIRREVAWVRPEAVMEPLAAAPVTSATTWVWEAGASPTRAMVPEASGSVKTRSSVAVVLAKIAL
jgi:hypothetical protein